MRKCDCFILTVVLLVSTASTSEAQPTPVRLEGSLNLSSELYSSTGIAERRPKQTARAILAPTLVLFDQIRLPFEIFITNDDRGYRQPFNQFGVSPRLWGWLTLHAGYFSSQLSELSFGDTRLLGGGVELTPGDFRFSLLYGRSQHAVNADTANDVRGLYERTVLAAKLGYGAENSAYVHLQFLRAWDDSTSLALAPSDVVPVENLVASIAYGVPLFGDAVRITGETAVSAFSNDTRSPEDPDFSVRVPSILFTPRHSSQVDGATTLALAISPSPTFSLSLNGKWVGPGYVTLGYFQLPSDVVEGMIAPTIRLLDNALILRGSLGLRFNNLRDTKSATTRRTIGNVMVNIQPSPVFGMDIQYANYGMRSAPRNDTLRIDNIAQSFSFSPRYSFPLFGGTSTTLASYGFQDFTDFNTITGALSNNQSHSGMGMWSLIFPSSFSLTSSVNYTSVKTSVYAMSIAGVNETVGYAFFDNRLSTSVTVGYNVVHLSGTDGQVTARLNVTYATAGWGAFTFSLMNNRYTYADASLSPSFSEAMGSLQYSLGF